MPTTYKKIKIIKIHGSFQEEIEDFIAVEKKLNLSINDEHVITFLCTPLMIEELINGFILSEGIFKNKISREDMTIEYGDEINININKGINKNSDKALSRFLGGIALNKRKRFKKIVDNFTIKINDLQRIFEKFQKKSELFRLTGCFHSAALSDGKKIIVFAEDIGRHNTVDKIIGYSILNNLSFNNKLVLLSCRISSDIVLKCSTWKIPVLASRAAPTDLAINIAEKCGITLIGFVRGNRLNIYTNKQRIHTRNSSL